jgi:ACS family tartrate transporter-like MFS transporter
MLLVSWHSDRLRAKVPYIIGLSLFTAVCFAVSGLAHQPWIIVTALGLATISYYGCQGPALSLSTTFLDGPAAAIGIAAINMLSIIGGFVGPNWMGWSIQHGGGTRMGTGMLSIAFVLAAIVILLVRKITSSSSG